MSTCVSQMAETLLSMLTEPQAIDKHADKARLLKEEVDSISDRLADSLNISGHKYYGPYSARMSVDGLEKILDRTFSAARRVCVFSMVEFSDEMVQLVGVLADTTRLVERKISNLSLHGTWGESFREEIRKLKSLADILVEEALKSIFREDNGDYQGLIKKKDTLDLVTDALEACHELASAVPAG